MKAVSHQNDSLPDGDTSPDEAQQKQGIAEGTEARVLDQRFTLESINRPELGFDVQQFVFHRESPAPASQSVSLELRIGASNSSAEVVI